MKTFKDLKFKKHPMGDGIQAKMNFNNNYGVSVVKTSFSYGGNSGYYEIAILYKGEITYNTHITDDVIGWQTEENITEVMEKVQKLTD